MYSYIYHPISKKKINIHSREGLNIIKKIVSAQRGGDMTDKTNKQLRDKLRSHGLKVSGIKEELIKRLKENEIDFQDSISPTSHVRKSRTTTKSKRPSAKTVRAKKNSKKITAPSDNLSVHSTFLANINELSTGKYLSELLRSEGFEEWNRILNICINSELGQRLEKAVAIKIKQGENIANKLLSKNSEDR